MSFSFSRRLNSDKQQYSYKNSKISVFNYLKKIHGLGNKRSLEICKFSFINPNISVFNLKDKELKLLEKSLNKKFIYQLDKSLHKFTKDNIFKLKRIKSYNGIRHALNLSVRGQRTKTNCSTSRKYGK